MITGITHHRYTKQFATCGESTLLWDTGRNLPLQEFDWGVDTVHSVKFNPVESDILGACASGKTPTRYGPQKQVQLVIHSLTPASG